MNSPLQIIELDLPAPKFGEVLVKVIASGICHTQLLEIKGENATGPHNPNFLGHEGAGIVVSVGEGVSKVKVDDHVILSWLKGKGKTNIPKPILHNNQWINRGAVTTFSEYTVVSESRVTPIRKDMPLVPAALIGCAVATGMGMVFNNAKIEENDSIVIMGCGGIGINAIHAASISKANPIVAVDRLEEKLTLAHKFGATHSINSSIDDTEEKLKQLTNQEGLDYAIDTIGKKHSMQLVYNVVKKQSGKAILCGVPNPPGQTIEIDPFPLYYGKKIVGTSGGETKPDVDFNHYCDMYMAGVLRLDEMISHQIRLYEINEGISLLRSGNCLRIILVM